MIWDKVKWIITQLNTSKIDYALGEAIALGFYVAEPRATHDVDINIFV